MNNPCLSQCIFSFLFRSFQIHCFSVNCHDRTLGYIQPIFKPLRIFSDTLEDKWKFRYDSVWGGVFLRGTNGELHYGVDYGFPYYNDHHFHLGYFLYAAAYYVKHHRVWGDGEVTEWLG